ncbi:hypothetical protein FRZ03_27970 [Streptomyces misionensis]|uniref:Uncharacterized protein n=1 Tax=Streptomyces misionensis TaxID=67331 RepID=A0A5C6J010_9ACTN|nr:hypothetical protein FRZ03_27970 [Streptomyces misionensis]
MLAELCGVEPAVPARALPAFTVERQVCVRHGRWLLDADADQPPVHPPLRVPRDDGLYADPATALNNQVSSNAALTVAATACGTGRRPPTSGPRRCGKSGGDHRCGAGFSGVR